MNSVFTRLARPLKRLLTVVNQPETSSVANMGSSNTKSKKIGAPMPGKCNAPCSSTSDVEEFVESVVCQESDLADNQMREFDLGGKGKVLLVKQGGRFSAIGTKCSHYGAPLATGVLGDGRVRCPWHGACFDIGTGDIEDFPGLDSLPCYQVNVESDGGVRVRARTDQLANPRRVRLMARRDPLDKTTHVVVGMGAAGACCVETLRQEGFRGRVVFIGREPHIPYDRIKLSKALDSSAEKLHLRSAQFYKDHDIETMTDTEVTGLDPEKKTVTLGSGEVIEYNAICLATGSQPRRGTAPGSDLSNVCVLRSVAQANHIAGGLTAESNVVIVGSSFIGMEVATFCVGKAASVTVLARDSVPFRAVLGEAVGRRIMDFFKEKGVKFELQCGVDCFRGEDGSVTETVLTDGRVLPSNVVVLGIGADPCTEYLVGSGVELGKGGAVVVDEYLQSTAPDVYAAGDIAFAPVLGTSASIGHWQLAHYHGRVAALNMLNLKKPLATVPFFWTMFFGKSVRYSGYAPAFDSVVLSGDLAEFKFVAYYCVGDRVAAVATAGRDPVAAKFAERLAEGKVLTKAEVEVDADAWTK